MELKDKCTAASDDEDDLEKLRLAALQSIKRQIREESKFITKNTGKLQNHHKRRQFPLRNLRNGQFYARQKNTNLISIPTVSDEPDGDLPACNKPKFSDNAVHRLVLPQDRYCNPKSVNDKPTESSSKFDRYDNSDKSDSESEYDKDSNSESESPGKLEKASSLEALMQELENEIQGDSKPKDDKIKSMKSRKRKQKLNVSDTLKESKLNEEVPIKKNEETENKVESVTTTETEKVEVKEVEKDVKHDIKKNVLKTSLTVDCKKPPLNKMFRKQYYPDRNLHNTNTFILHQPYPPSNVFPGDVHYNQNLNFNPIIPYNPNVNLHGPVVPINPPNYIHPVNTTGLFDRPPSPLTLNTDDALTITRAPLSPRSAAFVLQNREIIERRKKSPRRSYSRSPSPRYRRSKSPVNYGRNNRSPSPRKFLKSKSRSPQPIILENLRKASPPKEKVDAIRERRSPIADRRSPLQRTASPLRDRRSPPRSKISPLRQKYSDKRSPNTRRSTPGERSPKPNYRNSPKATIHERLGSKTLKKITNVEPPIQAPKLRKRSRSLSPETSDVKEKIVKSEKDDVLDPVLEARRKKFETNEIKNIEGIIRLKPKTENSSESESVKECVENIEDSVQDDEVVDFLDAKVDDIFSDEDTDEENEGRFKSSLNKPNRNVSVLPFTQLLDNSTKNLKTDVLKSANSTVRTSDKDCTVERSRKRQRSRSPLKNKDGRNYKDRAKIDDPKSTSLRKTSAKDKLYTRNKILFRNGSSSRKEKIPIANPRESKKIEIRIRNPSKYETTSKYDVANEHETLERLEKNVRKVEVSDVKKESDENDSESEIVKEIEEEIEEKTDASLNQKCEAGDLRAQLSRKRAERQNKLPVAEDVQSRLLQNALQGAVFKKPKKSRKEREAAPKGTPLYIIIVSSVFTSSSGSNIKNPINKSFVHLGRVSKAHATTINRVQS
ncbi:hypothetical protein MML48_8g00016932 [Holotrichia oblita]|uniref:Uncharacterized protein n=1 Tax=Holotrichia oblita TaxID=644536 RepID=A0ACB9SM67_HOLOL|nr:hypothetical protein MML48_8g00016932 [Holotrichia oblita]